MAEYSPAIVDGSGAMQQLPAGNTVAGLARVLFKRCDDKTTTGLVEETLYTNSIIANTLISDDGILEAKYVLTTAANGNDKYLSAYFAGTKIFDSATFNPITANSQPLNVELSIQRVSNTVVRYDVWLQYYDPAIASGTSFVWGKYNTISSLNLSATAYDLIVKATTSDAIGDLTARKGRALYLPGV